MVEVTSTRHKLVFTTESGRSPYWPRPLRQRLCLSSSDLRDLLSVTVLHQRRRRSSDPRRCRLRCCLPGCRGWCRRHCRAHHPRSLGAPRGPGQPRAPRERRLPSRPVRAAGRWQNAPPAPRGLAWMQPKVAACSAHKPRTGEPCRRRPRPVRVRLGNPAHRILGRFADARPRLESLSADPAVAGVTQRL